MLKSQLEEIKDNHEFRKGEGWELTTLTEDIDWLIGQAKELSNIKRLLNDMRRLERNGQLFVDGEAYNIQYNRSIDELE